MRKTEYPKTVKTIGQRIRKRRMDQELTLLKLADAVGVTESYMSRIEAGLKIPAPELAIKIGRALKDEYPWDYFFWATCAGKEGSPYRELKRLEAISRAFKIEIARLPNTTSIKNNKNKLIYLNKSLKEELDDLLSMLTKKK